jgi:2-dehydro-3-deoxy-D-arabinonate dehydratase
MKLYLTDKGIFLLSNDQVYHLPDKDFDHLINRDDLLAYLNKCCSDYKAIDLSEKELANTALAPIQNQEVWAAGVTYYKSKKARMDESKNSGGSTFYDKIYDAKRPELFFKSTASRVRGPNNLLRVRKDSNWTVPEPELALLVTAKQKIIGYSIGNDMSARDIEGENPLYLPQAKSYEGSTALGPCLLILDRPLNANTRIELQIRRKGMLAFSGETSIKEIKRSFEELASYLFLELDFPKGCYLMTGTGIVPDDSFSILSEDEIYITIEGIGTLKNSVA